MAASTHGLARIYHGRKQHEQARALYERTMAIQAKHLDQQHPDCWDTFWSYQALLRETGQNSAAEDLPRTPYTLLEHLRRLHGTEAAERLIREMIEKRRRDRER